MKNKELIYMDNQRIEIIGGGMQEIIRNFAEENHIDIIKVVDITALSVEENRGFSYAILLVKVLPKEYIDKLNHEKETDHTFFLSYEIFNKTDELADELATIIQEKGYKAISQSEKRSNYSLNLCFAHSSKSYSIPPCQCSHTIIE